MVMGYPEENEEPKTEVVQPAPTPGLGGAESNIQQEEKVNKFGIPYKAIIGFFSVFVGQLVARSFVEGVPVIPTNTSGILALLGGSLVAALGIYFKANLYTVPDAQKNLEKAVNKAA